MTALWMRGPSALRPLAWLPPVLLAICLAVPSFADEPIAVLLDQARIMKLPERASTVVIGDPLIADLTIQPGGLAVVTGKGYGATNVIVLDRDGAVLTEKMIEVRGPSDPTVVVYKGVARETYSCTPLCSPRITLGDETDYFNKALTAASTRSSQAAAAAPASGPR
jgi:hypothetical protein